MSEGMPQVCFVGVFKQMNQLAHRRVIQSAAVGLIEMKFAMPAIQTERLRGIHEVLGTLPAKRWGIEFDLIEARRA